MNRKKLRWLEAQIASQCAPLLAGLKPSNLLIVPEWAAEELKEALKGTKFSHYCMARHGDKLIFLLYRVTDLILYLTEPEVQEYFTECDVDACEIFCLLTTVAERYESHLKKGTEFPHELGLLLGYPVVDVRGFVQHGGKKFIYSGYWKVYGNPMETKQLFQEFGKAKKRIMQLYYNGYTISDIVEEYRVGRQRRMAM